ncbi:divergent polysaccharide deacetylase family protein [Paenibacillus sp. FJAT-26967]|uniref:divergent polysaccharide deacetylase family protein n=1 Tax=Paenibacillus sp. FJAT-26967 TaxID=1729690 RepID=UPI000AD21BFD|nr:divergent polysaccharide deacetylase family protein [Paenibacillus sp. FJAT-26967]
MNRNRTSSRKTALSRALTMGIICVNLLTSANPLTAAAASISEAAGLGGPAPKSAAIVIDDFGNNMKGTDSILDLPIPLTVAVMPFLSSSKSDAQDAFRKGREVIVHLPMEPMTGKKSWLGPGVISTDLSEEEIRKRVNAAIDDIPHAIGVNNHMGSKATADERVMHIVMEVLRERGLFFLDSHTNYRSIACREAKKVGVPCLENHIFLDDIHTKSKVIRQIELIGAHNKVHQPCIAIGHVGAKGDITAAALRDTLPRLKDTLSFVKLSELYKSPPPDAGPKSGS